MHAKEEGEDFVSEEKDSLPEEVKEDVKKDDEYEKICYICHRPESKTGKMLELMNLTICPDCLQKSFSSMSHMDPGSYKELMELSKRFPNMQMINLSDIPEDIPNHYLP